MNAAERGVSLLDAVIGAALVVIVLSLAYPGIKLADDTIATGGTMDRLERSGDRMLKELTALLRSGLLTGSSPPGVTPWLTVARLRPDIEIGALDARDPRVFEEVSVRIEFRPAGPLPELAARADLNRDGDRADTFTIGTIVLLEGDRERPLSGRPLLLLPTEGEPGDLDGDGLPDPLFRVENRTVFLTLHLVDREPNGRLLRTSTRSSVTLRNSP